MIFALLTLLTALSLAAVAGWFSIVGFMAIYAGAPMAALIMGAVTEVAKLVTISWLYRNWKYSNWRLKAPLIYFTVALMVATSIGVFGFLSKGHLEQGAGTIDNSAKIEQLNYQINREKSLIADNEKVIGQLDATVNSFLGKDRTDRSLSVRKSQAPQRKQLRDESDAAQKRIDTLSADKFKLESEIRSLQLEVGPIRYIAELFYGVEENATKNIESAVRLFTLLIVSTLDPLAVILLIAANHTLLRLRNEKEEKKTASESGNPVNSTSQETNNHIQTEGNVAPPPPGATIVIQDPSQTSKESTIRIPIQEESLEVINEEEKNNKEEVTKTSEILLPSSPSDATQDPIYTIREIFEEAVTATASEPAAKEAIPEVSHAEIKAALEKISENRRLSLPPAIVRQPSPTQVTSNRDDITAENKAVPEDSSIIRELRGNTPHFIPKKVHDDNIVPVEEKIAATTVQDDKYPKALSWLAEFKRS